VFDFVHPIRAERRPSGAGGNAGFHESCRDFPARGHIGAIAACSDQPQSSSGRGAENIALLERAKKHKIAALTTLMISRGMFSRDHISTLSPQRRLTHFGSAAMPGHPVDRVRPASLLQKQVCNCVK
jgi:hypothetical protein